MALWHSERALQIFCTTHVLDEYDKVYNINVVNKYVPHRNWLLINIAKRTQGLIVQKNPKSLSGIKDIAKEGITFVNRQVGSGTKFSSMQC